jgi:hypothetical protein
MFVQRNFPTIHFIQSEIAKINNFSISGALLHQWKMPWGILGNFGEFWRILFCLEGSLMKRFCFLIHD